MSELALSIVIPTFNRRASLDLCLRAILRTDTPADQFEVLVIDDGGTDGTAEHVGAEFSRWQNVRCVRRPKKTTMATNPGLARNVGLRQAKGAWVAFLDDDVLHGDDVISATLRALDGPGIYSCFGAWLERRDFDWGARQEYAGSIQPDWVPRHYWWAAERATLLEIGGFDERFQVYGGEDGDLMARLGRMGLPRKRVPVLMVMGLYAKRGDAGDYQAQNAAQHELLKADKTIVRNVGVDWGRLDESDGG